MFREAWEIAVICVEGAILAAVIIVFVIGRIIAGRYRIIKIRFPIYPLRFALLMLCAATFGILFVQSTVSYREFSDYIDDMEMRGIAAVADYENTTVDELLSGVSFIGEESYEEIYVERETARFQSLTEDARRNMTVFGANALAVALLAVLGGGAYFTRKGVMFFTGFRLQKTSATVNDGKILVYINNDFGKALAKFPMTSTNRKNFSGFLIDDILTED